MRRMMMGIQGLVVLLVVGGCASWLPKVEIAYPSDVLISSDFINAFMQIDDLHPATTTLQFEREAIAEDAFLVHLQQTAREAGYGIQIVSASLGNTLVEHKLTRQTNADDGLTSTHEIAIGSVRMRREYALGENDSVRPVAGLFVKGVDASDIVAHDAIFDDESELPLLITPAAAPAKVPSTVTHDTNPVLAAGPAPEVADEADSRVSAMRARAMPLMMPATGTQTAVVVTKPAMQPVTQTEPILPISQNIADIGKSNYGNLFAEFSNVDEQILTFGNDSLWLGKVNKWFIKRAVSQFDPEKDVFSIIGCSLGPTNKKSGNEGLAIGRAKRVKEALMFAGVPEDHILEEGCWSGAGDVAKKMPSRGVVLTLKRKNS